MRVELMRLGAWMGLPDDLLWGWVWGGVGALAVLLIAFSLWRNGRRGWGWVCVGFVLVAFLVVWRVLWEMISNDPSGPRPSRFSATGWLRGRRR